MVIHHVADRVCVRLFGISTVMTKKVDAE